MSAEVPIADDTSKVVAVEGGIVTDERVTDHELADRLVRVTELTAVQALSLVQRLDADDAASRNAVIAYLAQKEAGRECKLQWITKDGSRVWARIVKTPG